MNPLPEFFAAIPAGGAGKRLWPLSRQAHPKFLLDLSGEGRTLIQQAWDRLEPLAGAGHIEVVTGAAHAAAVTTQLDRLNPANLIVEPGPRDSMPAIALAAAVTQRRHGDVVLGSFAADHIIHGQKGFAAAVEAAYLAAQEGFIATIGIVPSGPSTAYGYIKSGPSLGLVEVPEVALVAAFKEKPDKATAAEYLAAGGYRWNAGMFVFKVNLLLDQLELLHPALADGIGQLADAWDGGPRDEVAAKVWPRLQRIAFDHAIAEPVAAEGGLATVPGDFVWSDIGDFGSLAELAEPVGAGRPGSLAGARGEVPPQIISGGSSDAGTAPVGRGRMAGEGDVARAAGKGDVAGVVGGAGRGRVAGVAGKEAAAGKGEVAGEGEVAGVVGRVGRGRVAEGEDAAGKGEVAGEGEVAGVVGRVGRGPEDEAIGGRAAAPVCGPPARQLVLNGSPAPVVEDSPGALALAAGGRLVALLGVPGVVVVDTPDAVLVTSLSRAQEVKQLVESLERRGQSERL
ncbi:MAG: hypothetical protein LBC97_06960 [Bifidobacteriaceae bacterium]|nr:hypothetical protein [Bifidobacteriaceae bacterium]